MPLFEALRGSDRNSAIAPLLTSSDSEIVQHCLGFISGYHSLWPDNEFDFMRPSHLRDFLPQYLPAIQLIAKSSSGTYRSTALALYGEMAHEKSIPLMRSLLDDRDEAVRVTAMSWLIRYKDQQSVRRIAAASKSILHQLGGRSANETNAITNLTTPLSLLVDSRRLEYIPTLIEYLDYLVNSRDASFNYVTVRDKLQSWIGFRFPPNRLASLRAWDQVKGIKEPKARREKLASLLGNWEHPLTATAKFVMDASGGYRTKSGSGTYSRDSSYSKPISPREEALLDNSVRIEVVVTNESHMPVTIAAWPYAVKVEASESGAESTPDGPRPKRRFVTLQPGTSFRTKLDVAQVLGRKGEKVHLTLDYSPAEAPEGVYPWIGKLETDMVLPRAMP